MGNYNTQRLARNLLVIQGEEVSDEATVSELHRYNKDGDFYVVVSDLGRRREILITDRTLTAATDKTLKTRKSFERAKRTATELAPDHIEPPPEIYQAPEIRENRPNIVSRAGRGISDLSSRVWYSSPAKDFKRALLKWGAVGTIAGSAIFGGLKGYNTADRELSREEVAEIRDQTKQPSFFTKVTSQELMISFFNRRAKSIEAIDSYLKEIKTAGKERFTIDDIDKIQNALGYRKDAINRGDNHISALNRALSEARSRIDKQARLGNEILKLDELATQVEADLVASGYKGFQVYEHLRAQTKEKLQELGTDGTSVAIRINSPEVQELEKAVTNYRSFIEAQRKNGYINGLVNKEIDNTIEKKVSDISGGIGILGGFISLVSIGLGYLAHDRIRKRGTKQTNNEPDPQEQAILHALEKPQQPKPKFRIPLNQQINNRCFLKQKL